MSDYDSYLARCVEDYYNPRVSELTIRGRLLYDIIVFDGKSEKLLKNVPLNYWKNIDFTDEHYRWDDICDTIDDYFDLSELDCFEFDEVLNENETYLPDDYKIIKIVGISDGYSFEDLEVTE